VGKYRLLGDYRAGGDMRVGDLIRVGSLVKWSKGGENYGDLGVVALCERRSSELSGEHGDVFDVQWADGQLITYDEKELANQYIKVVIF